MKAIKKPVVIECFKYDGDMMDSDGNWYVPDWAKEAYEDGVFFIKDRGDLYIKTLEGDMDMFVNVGNYVIQDANGEIYPCKPDIFEKTYEIVEE